MSFLRRATRWLRRTRNPQITSYFRDKIVPPDMSPNDGGGAALNVKGGKPTSRTNQTH